MFRGRHQHLVASELPVLKLAESAEAFAVGPSLKCAQLALLLHQTLDGVEGLFGPADLKEVFEAAHESGHVMAGPVFVQIGTILRPI